MRVWKHGCDIPRILIGHHVLSDARFDWLVGNMSMYQENLFQSRSKKTSIFLQLSNYLWEIFYKSNRGLFFRVSIASSKHSGELREFETVMQTQILCCLLDVSCPILNLTKKGNSRQNVLSLHNFALYDTISLLQFSVITNSTLWTRKSFIRTFKAMVISSPDLFLSLINYFSLEYTKTVDSVELARWLATQTPDILCYSRHLQAICGIGARKCCNLCRNKC